MAQFVTRLEDSLADRVDSLVAAGVLRSRSEAVRLGLAELTDRLERERIGRQIVEGYQRVPETEKELEGIDEEHLAFVRAAMTDVVNGGGTASRFRLPVPEMMAGKTGTAQVRRISMAERASGVRSNASLAWRMRDHSWFVCFAPAQAPRYAACFLVEHGGFGASAAAPMARDVLTYLFDKDRAMAALAAMEQQWGGTIDQRMEARARTWAAAAAAGESPPAPTGHL